MAWTCNYFPEYSDQEEDGEGEEEEEEENDEGDDDEDEDEEENGKRYEFRQRKAVVRYQAPLKGLCVIVHYIVHTIQIRYTLPWFKFA